MGKRKCAAINCNALEFRSVGYCNRHKDHYPQLEVIIPKKESLRITLPSDNSDIRYDIDGNKKRISSKSIKELLILLKAAKQYWVVDLGIDEDEFVQYAVDKGELEHWDDSKKIESKKMKMEDAFEILESKLLGDFTRHTKWWDDGEDLGKKIQILGIVSVVIFVILILLSGVEGEVLFWFLQLGAELFCGLILLGGGALTSLNRSGSGKFIK